MCFVIKPRLKKCFESVDNKVNVGRFSINVERNIAEFFDIDIRTMERYSTKFSDELKSNGYEILKG
jgi:hypothetical protein